MPLYRIRRSNREWLVIILSIALDRHAWLNFIRDGTCSGDLLWIRHTHTHTHTHIYIYIHAHSHICIQFIKMSQTVVLGSSHSGCGEFSEWSLLKGPGINTSHTHTHTHTNIHPGHYNVFPFLTKLILIECWVLNDVNDKEKNVRFLWRFCNYLKLQRTSCFRI